MNCTLKYNFQIYAYWFHITVTQQQIQYNRNSDMAIWWNREVLIHTYFKTDMCREDFLLHIYPFWKAYSLWHVESINIQVFVIFFTIPFHLQNSDYITYCTLKRCWSNIYQDPSKNSVVLLGAGPAIWQIHLLCSEETQKQDYYKDVLTYSHCLLHARKNNIINLQFPSSMIIQTQWNFNRNHTLSSGFWSLPNLAIHNTQL